MGALCFANAPPKKANQNGKNQNQLPHHPTFGQTPAGLNPVKSIPTTLANEKMVAENRKHSSESRDVSRSGTGSATGRGGQRISTFHFSTII
jgi:hypothetical protein